MRKFYTAILICVCFVCIMCPSVLSVSAESYCVLDASTRKVLYENNADARRGMASTTKIMTALLALESGKIDEVATVSQLAAGTEGSSLYLKAGEKMRIYDLICGLMLNSGNDAAVVIAEHIGGTVDDFVEMMNRKALDLNLKDTHFTNPNGLSDTMHYTTARELAYLTAYAMENPQFKSIVSAKNMVIETIDTGRKLYLSNHNKLLREIDGCNGVKTGFTKATGRCLVSSVDNEHLSTICVTLNAANDWVDHKDLHRNAFANFVKYTTVKKGETAAFAKVYGGQSASVRGIFSQDATDVYKKSDLPKCEVEISMQNNLVAPIFRGQTIGTATIYENEQYKTKVDIIAAESVAETASVKFKDILRNLLFRIFYL